jgi:antitoxin component of RelBE/YafQ-DinJ toxin-antitoxin module
MLIRDTDRTHAHRARSRDAANPLRRTAEGLGVFLDRLSEAVRDSKDAADSVDSALGTHGRHSSRGFKFFPPQAGGEDELPIDLNLSEEENEALDMLKEARNLAADATQQAMSMQERLFSQNRLQEIFLELSAKRIEILSSMLSEPQEPDNPLFSLTLPESARSAYTAIDGMIMQLLNSGAKGEAGASVGENSPYIDHEAALSASEQLREFLINEGPIKAFSRFREINRSHVLGLLQ